MTPYRKKTTDGKVCHFYGFDTTQSIFLCRNEDFPKLLKGLHIPEHACGVRVEPPTNDQSLHREDMPNNSLVLMFAGTDDVDALMGALHDCKKRIIENKNAADREMWQKRFEERKIINFSDYAMFVNGGL